jgi:hypothetical protein
LEETASLGTLTADDFVKHVNTVFTFHDGNREWQLRLISVSSLTARPGKRQPFSLVFTGAPGVVFRQQMYPLEHSSLGRLPIFLVPIGADTEGTQYEAVFS